ncbi:MarR family winged helix-turn-helix transcriptional regulator [Micromonospora sp. NBC_01796]|uniref:MarR family winged helix-turn-helix transcriptional regulator n=1 Tax=Micromonospora sp. NBC_01796 TaxID=2975987 RepID=UPI002DDC2B0B|nr:MarR family transcriptional regulator [Micromonospora sp. NBC_01796]WSA83466.1 MarR family transcriptional regulator [Micromonospora sp. NBC_01796]
MDVDELALDQQVCFALYATSRAVTDLYRPILDEFGLTYPQYLVLLVLWKRPDDPPTVKQLGAELHLDSGTLSPLLKRLERAGLVTRRRAARDERLVEIELTGAGRALRQRVEQVPRRIVRATGLTGPDLVALRGTLNQITQLIHQQKEQ